ncbi:choline/ethanolamine kinase [Chloropicon primus]|uniref:ethanolamine kinase n=1 Tax=Chloropicon primus TaxID=1764295 RepID=A0A5B8MBU8_9CHLO|nr:choline/ethanolamine kinase [Chloropicon primus]UPQ96809.1 choline/ethanolamine kinase [Chloropicon primus]|eukprot:QDZ17591.1 choline/ethanolamine kinase [Chloropicon primus]
MVENCGDIVKWEGPVKIVGETDENLRARREAQAVRICKALLVGWPEDSKAAVEVITGGVTNSLYKVTNADSSDVDSRTVALRVFGDNTDLLIDRDKELNVMTQLNARGFGAKVFATFANGRIEEYLLSKPMDYNMCVERKYISKIARLTAKFHAVEMDLPQGREPDMWQTLSEWYDKAVGLEFDDARKREVYADIDFEFLKEEIASVREACRKLRPQVVWSHGDLLPGNIMLDKETDEMTFIDFEYSTYGYQGFDIGNHWNECMGLECNIELYPALEKRKYFVEEYLKAWDEGAGGRECVNAERVGRLLLESEFFVVVSHIFWSVWSIIQAKYSKIDFDYIEYYEKRWKYYLDTKPAIFAKLEKVAAL